MKLKEYINESVERKADKHAEKAHAKQDRKWTGEKYIVHPRAVAEIVKKYAGKERKIKEMIAAALLHDTVEDTDTTEEDLKKMFGGLIASLVKELTSDKEEEKRIGKTQYLSSKMINMTDQALLIKLADRWHNILDFDKSPPKWVAKYTKQTNDILDELERKRKLKGVQKVLVRQIRKKLRE